MSAIITEFLQSENFYEWPYPHILVYDAFDPVTFAKMKAEFGEWDGIWGEYRNSNIQQRSEITRRLDNIFQETQDELVFNEFNFTYHSMTPESALIKDWHFDGEFKKYQCILYVGSGPDGWHEMLDTDSGKIKQLPYKENTILLWRNNRSAIHRFYSSTVPRYSVTMPMYYKYHSNYKDTQ